MLLSVTLSDRRGGGVLSPASLRFNALSMRLVGKGGSVTSMNVG